MFRCAATGRTSILPAWAIRFGQRVLRPAQTKRQSWRLVIMLGRKSASALSTITLTFTLALGSATVQAMTCKGMEITPCQKNESCSWVKAYTRKDGVKVAGHCKSKPGKPGGKKKSESKE
jgi:hypothetical protein